MKRKLSLAMAAVLGAMALTACSSEQKAETTAAKAEAAKTETAQEAAPEGAGWKSGDTVYFDVPAKAGGGTDLYTRYLTQALGEVCPGVNFVVTNYDTGEVGMEHVKNADPDGLTLGANHGGAILQYLCGSSEVSIKDDLKVVGILNQGGPQAIIAAADAPYKNLVEFGEYMKANPGDQVIGCNLGGTTQFLFTSLVNNLTGDATLANYVQCASEADKLTNVASGAINVANCSIPNAQSYLADGKVTVLGVIGPKVATYENMQEMLGTELDPAFATAPEQGVDATWDSCYYVVAPKDTPDEICEAINDAMLKAVEQQSFVEGNKKMATYIDAINYADTKATFENEWKTMDELATSMGLKVR